MRMRNLLFMILLWLVTATGAWADNMVSILTTEGAPRTEVTVSINLDNTDMVSSLQVTIPVDDNLTVVEGSGLPTSRCPDHTVAVSKVDGQLQVYIYSLSMACFSGSSDVVATFKLKLGDMPGDYNLIPSKVVLTDAEGTALECMSSGTYQTIRGPYLSFMGTEELDFGGVPTNEKTLQGLNFQNIGNDDLVITGLAFSDVQTFTDESWNEYPYTLHPGEWGYMQIGCTPTSRQPISQTMTVLCNSTTSKNMLRLKAQPYVVNVLSVESASGVSDEEVTISLTMKNEDAVSGYQVEFDMPRSLQFVEGSFALSDRKADHISSVSFANDKLRIIVYSPTDSPFNGNSGEVGSFKVKLNGRESTDLTPINVILSATINNVTENVCSDWHGAYISIICPYIMGEEKLYFGDIPVTMDCIALYRLYNNGQVPLVISRIVFDNENLSVDEELPLTIEPWNERYITIRYNSLEEVPFNAVMQIHSNDPEMRLKEVKLWGSRFAPNYLYVTMPDIAVDDEARMIIDLDNYDPILGIQFDVVYPQENFMPYEGNYSLTPLAQNMSVDINRIDENTIRYMLYSMTGEPIERGSRNLMNISFKPRQAPERSYEFIVKNIKLGTANMTNKHAGSDIYMSMKVWDSLPGDVNADSKVNVADIVETVNSILGRASGTFIFAAADVNTDGWVDIFDVTAIVNIILKSNHQYAPDRRAGSNRGESVWLNKTDQGLSFGVDHAERYTAFQFDIVLPRGVSLVDIDKSQMTDHNVRFAKIGDNRYRILAMSMDCWSLPAASRSLLDLVLSCADQGEVAVDDVVFVTPEGRADYYDGCSLALTTGIQHVTYNQHEKVYNLFGHQLSKQRGQLTKGVYIINNKKVVVK